MSGAEHACFLEQTEQAEGWGVGVGGSCSLYRRAGPDHRASPSTLGSTWAGVLEREFRFLSAFTGIVAQHEATWC